MLQEPGVDLHLSSEHRLHLGIDRVPGRDPLVALGEFAVLRDDAQFLLFRERAFAHLVPAVVELALVLVRPCLRDVVWGVRRPWREVHEERLVGRQGLQLAGPGYRLVREVLGQVVSLLRRFRSLDGLVALVESRVPLVGLAADEAVEVLEAAPSGPAVEWAGGTRLPDWHLVALAELCRRVAVQAHRLLDGRLRVRTDRVVPGRAGRDLGDATHPDRVVVPTAQQRRSGRRAERRGMEARVLQAVGGQLLERRRLARAAERAGCAEADVVDQDHQHVRCAGWWSKWHDRRDPCLRLSGVVRRHADVWPVRDRQDLSLQSVAWTGHVWLLFGIRGHHDLLAAAEGYD